jgi:HSP20 family molecular chaperone IbpA
MTQRRTQDRAGRFVRSYEYADETVLAVDLTTAVPGGDDAVSVDTVDGTAIVVVDRGDDEEEFEFDIPGEATRVETNNGVLTITVES